MNTLSVILFFTLLIQSDVYEPIYTFHNKKGETLGSLQGIKKNNEIYTHLRIVGNEQEVLYFIDKTKLYSGEDLELDIVAGGEFYGYKIILTKPDYVVLSYLTNDGKNVSDDITIEYDYKQHKFKRLILP